MAAQEMKIIETRSTLLTLTAIGAMVASPAHAYILVSGQIGSTETVGTSGGAPGNYDFRIWLASGAVICNGQNWAYVNVSDGNYAAIVASTMTARAMGTTVTIAVTQDALGYCQLSYIAG
jgi:hypothetical protein